MVLCILVIYYSVYNNLKLNVSSEIKYEFLGSTDLALYLVVYLQSSK